MALQFFSRLDDFLVDGKKRSRPLNQWFLPVNILTVLPTIAIFPNPKHALQVAKANFHEHQLNTLCPEQDRLDFWW